MHYFTLVSLLCALLISAHAIADTTPVTVNPDEVQTIGLDGSGEGRVFEGIGGLSAGAASRLLMDYPEPQRSQILDFMFKPNFGMSLHHLKVEIGGTVNSTWGSEPSFANTREEFENPKPEYFDRGYEYWLMKEARKRNPDIILEGLQWGAPGWIGSDQPLHGRHGNKKYFTQDNADYVAEFIKGARDYHGITMDYQGIRNEAGYDVAWIKTLRKTLDANGLQDVKLAAADDAGDVEWKIAKDVQADPELNEAVYALSVHYVPYTSTDLAKSLGKPLWGGEFAAYGEPWGCAKGFVRMYNRHYSIGRMTKTIICTPITSLYDHLAPFATLIYSNPGLMKANTPWSGHYEIPMATWATAHTTQFAKPGWRYIDGGCGFLNTAGSYVTLTDGNGNYSIIIETLNNLGAEEATFLAKDDEPYVPTRQVKFNLKNLSTGTVHVWRTNQHSQFEQLEDITPENGSFTITLDGNSIYSLTTTTGQRKGSYEIPKDSPFPFPYKDNFEKYKPGKTPRYFSDQEGTFEVAKRTDGRGKCLRQIVPHEGIKWFVNMESPWTVIGDPAWKDYEVSVDVHVGSRGSAAVYGRVDDPLVKPLPGGYGLSIDTTGAWQLKDTATVLKSGKIEVIPDSWHNLKLKFSGVHVIAEIDGMTVCSIMDDFHPRGSAAIASSYEYVEFDNFTAKPFKGRAPKSVAAWENLARGAKATASSQASDDNSAEKTIDGNHTSGWYPEAGKIAGEWLEVDFGKEVTFDRIIVGQRLVNPWVPGGIDGYKIQYWDGVDWKDAFTGGNMAVRHTDDFPAVTSSKARLLITTRLENSCIYEFQVYRHKQ